MPRVPRRITALLIGVLCLFVSGCGSDELTATPLTDAEISEGAEVVDEEVANDQQEDLATQSGSAADSDDATETDEIASQSNPDTDNGDAGDDDPEPAKESLSDYLGSMGSLMLHGDFDRQALAEEQKLVDRAVQRCMQDQGFEYIPGGPSNILVFGDPPSGEPSRETVAERGWGISTGLDEIFDFDFESMVADDPNRDMLEALSDGERQAWRRALDGEPLEITREMAESMDPNEFAGFELSNDSCRGRARNEVQGDMAVIGELSDLLDEQRERQAADPEVVQIEREWSACMAEAGFNYESETEARAEIEERVMPIMQNAMVIGGPPETVTQEGIDQPDQPQVGAAVVVRGPQLSEEAELALAELQRDEIAVATASFVCREPFVQQLEEIAARYEAEFVEENRDTLEGLR